MMFRFFPLKQSFPWDVFIKRPFLFICLGKLRDSLQVDVGFHEPLPESGVDQKYVIEKAKKIVTF